MITWFLIVWISSIVALLTGAIIFWRRLSVLRSEVRRFLADEVLSSEIRGPGILRDIHQDLREIASRHQEISRRIADEDSSLRAILSSNGVYVNNK